MTRDYAKPRRAGNRRKNARVRPSRQSTPGWVWMVAGILIGALAMGIFRFAPDRTGESTPAVTAENPDATPPEGEKEGPKPRFDFYTLLKETEVMVPEQDGGEPPQSLEITPLEEAPEAGDQAGAEQPDEDVPTIDDTTATSAPDPDSAPEAAEPRTVYVLQAGSFKRAADADSVRASLLLLNLQASIEKVTTNNNETWHRVLIGPFTTQAESSKVRQVLTRNGIDSIQLKRRL